MQRQVFWIQVVLMASIAAWADVKAYERTVDVPVGKEVQKQKQLVLENGDVRLAVAPDPGGTIVEFVNLSTGENFCSGPVVKGRTGRGWKDYARLHHADPPSEWAYNQPYRAEFRTGQGYKSIYVKLEKNFLRIEREMRINDTGRELRVAIKYTNIGKKPRRLHLRWHPYMVCADPYATSSVILSPGEPDVLRKIFVGWGWDHTFYTRDPYWMAANWKTGEGIWMTYRKEEVPVSITWTDYKQSRRSPSRGMFTCEPYPFPVLAKPGESTSFHGTYYLFTKDDESDQFPMGEIRDPDELERARAFLKRVRPHILEFATYTMVPPGNKGWFAEKANRFHHNHRRRDRVAIKDWGVMDAMLAAHALQKTPIRLRYFAQLFSSWDKNVKVRFEVKIYNDSGKLVKRHRGMNFTLVPGVANKLDIRDDVTWEKSPGGEYLPDGNYTIVVEGFAGKDRKPIHRYQLTRKMVQHARDALAETLKDARPTPERPFVKALRTIDPGTAQKGRCVVPIGVEEGGGIARRNWPVRCGVPFPKGMLPKNAAVALADPDGNPAPAQTDVMAVWPDGSLRWLLVDFQASCPAKGHVFYKLTATSRASSDTSTPILKADKEAIHYDTGTVLSGSFRRDSTDLFGLFPSKDLWWTDGNGQRYEFRTDGADDAVRIEENGPLRAVLRADGWYVDANGKRIARGDVRLELYRGHAFARLYHNATFAGSPERDKLGSYGITIRKPLDFSRVEVVADGRSAGPGPRLEVDQKTPDFYSGVCGKKIEGKRCDGVVRLHGSKGEKVVTIGMRNFWRLSPKKITADTKKDELTFSYWPADAGPMSYLPREEGMIPSSSSMEACGTGASRTHEFVLDYETVGKSRPIASYEATFFDPVIALAPPRWTRMTWANLHLAPYDPENNPELEQQLSDIFDAYMRHVELFGYYGEWYWGALPNFWLDREYRWADYGRYAYILNEEDIVQTPWLLYMRTGDRKYLKFAEANTRHLMEVATINYHDVWPDSVGMQRRHHECIWLGNADYGHSMLDPMLEYYHMVGYKPAWEAAKRMAKAMSLCRSGSWRYISNPLAGCSRMYLETGDRFYKEHAERVWRDLCYPDRNRWWVADHGRRAVMWYSQISPPAAKLLKEWVDKEAAARVEKKRRRGSRKESDFWAQRTLSLLWSQTRNPLYAAPMKDMVGHRDPYRRFEDPVLKGIYSITQYVLVDLAEKCYMGEALAEAKKQKEAK